MTVDYSAEIEVDGGIIVNISDDQMIYSWQWKIVEPTDLRLDETYSKVLHLVIFLKE